MWKIWVDNSYMVQILFACILFIIPAKKRNHFPVVITCSVIGMLLLSYLLSAFYEVPETGELAFSYWIIYILCAIVFVWINMRCSVVEALYCGICSCGLQHIAFDFYMLVQLSRHKVDPIPSVGTAGIYVMIYLVVYLAGYRWFVRKLADHGHYEVGRDSVVPLVTMILLVWVISIMELSSIEGFESGIYSHILYRIMDALCCFYVLWVQISHKEKVALNRELAGIHTAAKQQQAQYKMTSETIESINRKCHDLKHQIRLLKKTTDEKALQDYLDEIEDDIMIYDTALETGNRALDTVLMEKGLFCKNHDIQWSCMVDGTKLDFMKIEDIYAIFGNALENAVTAVMQIASPQKRVISVKILEQNQLLMIQIQNYYEGQLNFEKGLPLTTKKNKSEHGYGMKSIRYTAEKYDGIVTVQAKNNIFMLQILIPVN
jgi:uncharacterized protein YihD (DUF1040 family)